MLKLTLKRLLISRPWTFQDQVISRKHKEIETSTFGAGGQAKVVDFRGDFFDDSSPQSPAFLSPASHFDELAHPREFRRNIGNFAGGTTGKTTRVNATTRLLRFSRAVSLLRPSALQVGRSLARRRCDFFLLRCERARRRTFHDWRSAAVSPRDLAKHGFYFTGVDDVVQCVFCLGVLDAWNAADDDAAPREQYPARRHRRQLPHCPFVRGFDVHNVPGGNDQDELQGSRDLGLYVRLHCRLLSFS